jgi:hypothetical protein
MDESVHLCDLPEDERSAPERFGFGTYWTSQVGPSQFATGRAEQTEPNRMHPGRRGAAEVVDKGHEQDGEAAHRVHRGDPAFGQGGRRVQREALDKSAMLSDQSMTSIRRRSGLPQFDDDPCNPDWEALRERERLKELLQEMEERMEER